MNIKWITLSLVAAVLIVGVIVFAWKPGGDHADRVGQATVASTESTAGTGGKNLSSLPSCAGPMDPGVSRSELNDKYKRAEAFVAEKRFAAALPELRAVAILDPSYPGINLDISDALLQLKRPGEAKEAADAQMKTSQCLAKLPSDALDAYCGAEMGQMNRSGCTQRLDHLKQTAELQQAIVRLDLGHENGGAPETNVTAAYLAPQPQPHLPPAPRVPKAKPVASAVRPVTAVEPRRSSEEGTLIDGAGTDSSLGAYSKH